MMEQKLISIKEKIVSVADFPKPGIVFRDIFSVLRDPPTFKTLVDVLKEKIKDQVPDADVIVGLDSRGFLFGSILALDLGLPFVPIRKKGKLPGETLSISYKLEYGEAAFDIQKSSIQPGSKVVVIDDLLATGGTMKAASDLLTSVGATVSLCLVCIELVDLKGREKLQHNVDTVVSF